MYEITATNTGPEDARSPTITDVLPVGMTIIDFLSGDFTTGITPHPTASTPSFALNGFTIPMVGKMLVGDSYTARFSARFDQDVLPYANGANVCNEAQFFGETVGNELSA